MKCLHLFVTTHSCHEWLTAASFHIILRQQKEGATKTVKQHQTEHESGSSRTWTELQQNSSAAAGLNRNELHKNESKSLEGLLSNRRQSREPTNPKENQLFLATNLTPGEGGACQTLCSCGMLKVEQRGGAGAGCSSRTNTKSHKFSTWSATAFRDLLINTAISTGTFYRLEFIILLHIFHVLKVKQACSLKEN